MSMEEIARKAKVESIYVLGLIIVGVWVAIFTAINTNATREAVRNSTLRTIDTTLTEGPIATKIGDHILIPGDERRIMLEQKQLLKDNK